MTIDLAALDVVIAHEWITVHGGSENVVEALVAMFPRARLVASVVDADRALEWFPGHRVRALPLSRLPRARTRWPMYGPLMPAAWAAHRVGPADLLISSNHFAAMGAGRRFVGPHLSYVHTPMRMAWRPDVEAERLPPVLAPIGRLTTPVLRRVDRGASRHVDEFLANSTEVADRIRAAYGRPSTVVHPPVDTSRFGAVRRAPGEHLLVLGRLVSYKRVDLAVAACTRLGVRLVVAGDGPERARLEAMAGPTVDFVGRVSPAEQLDLLAGARALLFPGEDDFGIVPVEAQAAGCPVVAYGRGGALDTVDPQLGNVLVGEATPEAFAAAIGQVLDRDEDAALAEARRRAMDRFGARAFEAGISAAVTRLLTR